MDQERGRFLLIHFHIEHLEDGPDFTVHVLTYNQHAGARR